MTTQGLHNLYIFLGTASITSILVMDEEVLVLLCWILFVTLTYIYGSSVIGALFEERNKKFYKDMVTSYDFQEKALKILINYHMTQVLIINEVINLFYFSKGEIVKILDKRQVSFKFTIASQIEHKLSTLIDKENNAATEIQNNFIIRMNTGFLSYFLKKYIQLNNYNKKKKKINSNKKKGFI